MAKINVLSFEIANLIAAGEVVERPASVLKELIENSIDAGATSIVAEIKRGGVSLIRVSDNGCGIDKDDLPVALKRHATSKISSKDDLASIMTLGFRGEALAAISSVSKLTIITKTKEAPTAYMLTAEAGNIVDLSEVYAADGTTVVVSDLFYNVPARRKFLKKDATEAMNVAALVERVALSRPDISISLLIDGEEKFHTPGNSVALDTIYAIYGKSFASKLIEVKAEADGIRLSGYIGRSDNVKKNRNQMIFFINGRYVKTLTAQAAVEKAFTSYIAPEAFPTCVLSLDMNPSVVDVNVHPAKLEVKFSDERTVFEIVYHAVRGALEEHEYRPEMELGAKRTEGNPLAAFLPIGEDGRREQIQMSGISGSSARVPKVDVPPYITPRAYGDGTKKRTYSDDKPITFGSGTAPRQPGVSTPMTPRDSVELLERYRESTPTAPMYITGVSAPSKTAVGALTEAADIQFKLIGEAFDCYVLVEYDGALLIIDKHAAHERVIFEDLKAIREADKRVASQFLMLPISVILSPEELAAAIEYKSEIESVGFEYNTLDKSIDITAIPDAISAEDAESLIVKMFDDIIEGKGDPKTTDSIRREKALYQIACKAAIKGGRKYNREVIEWLVGKLLMIPDITVCPHGRPVAYRLTKNELDRQFERLK